MILVFFHHSFLSVNLTLISAKSTALIRLITGFAAIAFVMISGTVYSLFLYNENNWRKRFKRYAKRALVLILFAHPAINLTSFFFRANTYPHGSIGQRLIHILLVEFPITDTIGLCMLIAPFFIIKLRPLARFILITIILVGCQLLRYGISTESQELSWIMEAFIGTYGEPRIFWFPLLPWFAIFLSGSFIGIKLSNMQKGKLPFHNTIIELRNTAIKLFCLSSLFIIFSKSIRIFIGDDISQNLSAMLSADRLTTLFPGYAAILFMLLSWMIHRIELNGKYFRISRLLAILGRTSLFTFIIQFAVVESCPALLGLKGNIGLVGFISIFLTGSLVVTSLSFYYEYMKRYYVNFDFSFNHQKSLS